VLKVDEERKNRNWSLDELRVLAAIYFNASFSAGDDARDECRAIADCFSRPPASIDRQWRNMQAVLQQNKTYNIGRLVHQAVHDYVNDPVGSKAVALATCRTKGWPLTDLITQGRQSQPLEALEDAGRQEMARYFRDFLDGLQFKVFSTGSQGFFRAGKFTSLSGSRYQAQATAVLIGSKKDLTIQVKAKSEEVAYAFIPVVNAVEAKVFKTGRTGFYGQGKLSVGTERYQAALQAVEIGEKR